MISFKNLKIGTTFILLFLLLSSISLSMIAADALEQDDAFLLGDLNNDNVVNSLDSVILMNHINGSDTLDPSYLKAADINGDNLVNSVDYLLLKRHLLGFFFENDIIIEVVDSETGHGLEGTYLSFSIDGFDDIQYVYETDEDGYFTFKNVRLDVATRARINVMREGYITEEFIIYATSIYGEPYTMIGDDAVILYPEKIVEFEDMSFESYVRSHIDKPTGSIYLSDVRNITRLAPYFMCILSFEGIQHFHNLIELDFGNDGSFIDPTPPGHNQVEDLSPLAELKKLEVLKFGANRVKDISPLAELSNLRELSFNNNLVLDLSPLAGLKKLEILYFDANQVADLTPLSELSNLKILTFANNPIDDISPLSELSNLEDLAFLNTQVRDISPLSQLFELKQLWISNNLIQDISPVKNLSNLERLLLAENLIYDISVLVENDFPVLSLVNLADNNLNLQEGSVDMENIKILEERGITVSY
ncbi:leucine-rich repeat domain-containing protein [Natronospora cellulosivora (SeqCode)]